ncbi:hypothetical protein ACOSQ3_006021 [Xanthoceras sorbifolium]
MENKMYCCSSWSPSLGQSLTTESVLQVLDLALLDESEQVRIEAVLSVPVIVLWSGLDLLTHMFKRLEPFMGQQQQIILFTGL